jgi:hypothetical protein
LFIDPVKRTEQPAANKTSSGVKILPANRPEMLYDAAESRARYLANLIGGDLKLLHQIQLQRPVSNPLHSAAVQKKMASAIFAGID